MRSLTIKYRHAAPLTRVFGTAEAEGKKKETNVVFEFPNGRFKEHMADALTLKGDEGRSMAAINFGEVPSNL